METIVAFANCNGGNILIGVKNSFIVIAEIKGFLDQTNIEEIDKNIRNMIHSHFIPNVSFVLTKNSYKNKNVLVLEIPEVTKNHMFGDMKIKIRCL
jgi:predicted HTH transcriptional regulator